MEIEFFGLATAIDQLKATDIVGYVDMQDVMESEGIEEWKEGTYHAILQFDFREDIKTEQSISAKVILEKVEE